jgi:uncharacterized protein HemX
MKHNAASIIVFVLVLGIVIFRVIQYDKSQQRINSKKVQQELYEQLRAQDNERKRRVQQEAQQAIRDSIVKAQKETRDTLMKQLQENIDRLDKEIEQKQ